MIWFIAAAAMALITLIRFWEREENKWQHFWTCVGLFAGCCVMAFVFSILCSMLFFFKPLYVPGKQYQLVAIRDTQSIQGHFFLGCGQIGSDTYFFFYKQNADGSFTPDRIATGGRVAVFEEERKDAVLTIMKPKFAWDWIYLFSLFALEDDRYKFQVPTGTIRRGFSM